MMNLHIGIKHVIPGDLKCPHEMRAVIRMKIGKTNMAFHTIIALLKIFQLDVMMGSLD